MHAHTLKKTALATTFALTLSLAAAPDASAQAQGGPITLSSLQIGADATAVNFAWRTDYRGDEFVRIYETAAGADSAQQVKARRKLGTELYRAMHASVDKLKPATQYTYSLGSDKGGWSEEATFTTQNESATWNFLAFADAQIGASGDIASDGAGWQQTLTNAVAAYPQSAFLFQAGDQVDGLAPVEQYEQFLAPDELDQYPLAVAKGNHELIDGIWHYNAHYNMPNASGANYSFVRNNVLFIVVDSNADMLTVRRNIQRAKAKHGDTAWTIVGFHHAGHSYGGRYDQPTPQSIRRTLGPALSELGVDLVLNGHDHMYNRSHLINGQNAVVPETPAAPGDVLHPKPGDVLYLTMNSASGSKFYRFKGNDGERYDGMTIDRARELGLEQPTIAYFNQDRTPDYSSVLVSPDKLTVRTHNPDGSLVDEVTLDRKPAPTTPTSTPATTTAAEPTTPTTTTTTTSAAAPTEPTSTSTTANPASTTDTASTSTSTSEKEPKQGSADGSSKAGIFAAVFGVLALVIAAAAAFFQPQIREFLEQFGVRF